MPNETIMIDTSKYPELQGFTEGDQIKLTVNGKVMTNNEGSIEIQTDSIETEANNAQQFSKKMSAQPGLASYPEEEE